MLSTLCVISGPGAHVHQQQQNHLEQSAFPLFSSQRLQCVLLSLKYSKETNVQQYKITVNSQIKYKLKSKYSICIKKIEHLHNPSIKVWIFNYMCSVQAVIKL